MAKEIKAGDKVPFGNETAEVVFVGEDRTSIRLSDGRVCRVDNKLLFGKAEDKARDAAESKASEA